MPYSEDDLGFWSHLNLWPPPRPSHAEDFRFMEYQYPRLYQVFLPALNCDKIPLPNKHILHIVLQCLSFTVVCLKSSLWTWSLFFQPELGKDWLFSFIISIHWFWLVPRSALCGVLRQLYTHCFFLFDSFHPFCWSHHFGIQSDEICTLLP